MTRMAGDMDVSSFMSSGPNLGALSQKAFVNDAKEEIGGFKNEAMVNNTAMQTFADTSAHAAVTEAKGSYMAAQQQASNMSAMGGMAGNLIGGLGGLFG